METALYALYIQSTALLLIMSMMMSKGPNPFKGY